MSSQSSMNFWFGLVVEVPPLSTTSSCSSLFCDAATKGEELLLLLLPLLPHPLELLDPALLLALNILSRCCWWIARNANMPSLSFVLVLPQPHRPTFFGYTFQVLITPDKAACWTRRWIMLDVCWFATVYKNRSKKVIFLWRL